MPPGEPRALELGERVAAGEQAADAGRPAEHLVEGSRHEVRVPAAEVEPVGRHVCGGVEQHVPAVRVGLLDPLQRVLHAGEVRLRGVGEQVVVIAEGVGQVARQQALVHAQIGRDARDVGRLGAAGAGELADAVDRVVVVEREQEAIPGVEGVGLADEPQRAGRVGREDRDVLLRIGAEELQHPPRERARAARCSRAEVGLIECGLPNTFSRSSSHVLEPAASRRTGRRRCSRGTRGGRGRVARSPCGAARRGRPCRRNPDVGSETRVRPPAATPARVEQRSYRTLAAGRLPAAHAGVKEQRSDVEPVGGRARQETEGHHADARGASPPRGCEGPWGQAAPA